MTGTETADRVERFLRACRRNQAVSHRARTSDDAVSLVCERAAQLAEGGAVAVPAADALMDELGVSRALGDAAIEQVRPDDPEWRDRVAACPLGVTGSAAGVVETGTVALACGPGLPRAVSLLPDVHLCLVAASALHERFEDALTAVVGGGPPPNLVWVSGPSRSADIEKQITLGVHGPRTVEIVLVDL